MLIVDFMHEVELGVWKALFMHLVRILYAVAPSGRLVAILDERYELFFPARASRKDRIIVKLTGIAKSPPLARPSVTLLTTYQK